MLTGPLVLLIKNVANIPPIMWSATWQCSNQTPGLSAIMSAVFIDAGSNSTTSV